LKNAFLVFVVVWLAVALSTGARSEDARSLKLNQSIVGLLASEPGLAGNVLEIANAMDHTDGLRVLPIIGRGSLQSINDLLFLRGVDVALLSSDSLAFVKQNKLYTDETGKLAYLAKLANMNVIILARKEIGVIEDLPGMRIATGPANSDEFVAAELVFGALGTNYERVPTTGENSLAALLDGRIDAAVFTGADSYTLLNSIKTKSGLHILTLSLPESLTGVYSPAILSHTDFPNFIADGTAVETIAAALILAVFDWPERTERFYKLKKFNKALLSTYLATRSAEQSTNYSAAVPGWKQYLTAKDLMGANKPAQDSPTITTLQ
jgi:TRAP-type uncharacterized transport system substrate-binding protein